MKEDTSTIINPRNETEREEQKEKTFQLYPKNFSLHMLKHGVISNEELISILLRAMSDEDVRQALRDNGFTPRS